MGTRAFISVKIERKDRNKVKNFDPALLPQGREAVFTDMIPKDVKLKGKYLTIYLQHDGMMDSTGSALVAEFNSYEKALNLVLMGWLDSVAYKQLIPFGAETARFFYPYAEDEPTINEMCTGHIYKWEDGMWWHADEDVRKEPSEYRWRPISMSRANGFKPCDLSDIWQGFQERYDASARLRKLRMESTDRDKKNPAFCKGQRVWVKDRTEEYGECPSGKVTRIRFAEHTQALIYDVVFDHVMTNKYGHRVESEWCEAWELIAA